MKTALIHHPIYQKHDTGFGHPETPRRYEAVINALQNDKNLWESLTKIKPEQASQGLIQAAHTKEHFKRVEGAFENGLEQLDADTIVSLNSFDAAMTGAGGACRAVDAVMSGEAKNAFVAVRPPGHHATAEHAMGFCLFNNVAVAARYAQINIKKSSASQSLTGTCITATGRREFSTTTRRFSFFRSINIRGIRAAARAAKPDLGAARILHLTFRPKPELRQTNTSECLKTRSAIFAATFSRI
jgi:hypothetical protein